VRNRERHLRVHWAAGRVRVEDRAGERSYAARPGMLERNLLNVALADLARKHTARASFAVAGKDGIKTEHFERRACGDVEVPYGRFDAICVRRTDPGKNHQAWFAPARFGAAPLRVEQDGKDRIVLELVDWTAR